MNTPKKENKTIGILGGMGPLATVDLFRKIVDLCDCKTDQEHPRVLIDSNTNAPDRSPCILRGGPSPLSDMVRSALTLERGGADVLIMGCNTAHYFYEDIVPFVRIPFLNMLEETAKVVSEKGYTTVAPMGTDGTTKSGVYHREFEKYGIKVLTLSEEDQEITLNMIHDGVKAGLKTWDTTEISRIVSDFAAAGAQAVIMGCTELPVAFSQYEVDSCLPTIDPTEIIARSAIRFVGVKVRGE